MSCGGAEIYDGNFRAVTRRKTLLEKHENDVGLGNYPHYMLKETAEDANTVRETIAAFKGVDKAELRRRLCYADRIVVVGCGTAYNSGLVGCRLLEEAYGAFCQAEIASELRYHPPRVTDRTLVIAVSQSGETADTVEAAKLLKEMGARVIAVTNVSYSAITRVAHAVVPVCAGSEICVAATKSYVGQLVCFYLMAALAEDGGDAETRLLSAASAMETVLRDQQSAEEIALACRASAAVFFLGRGIDYAAAIEGSLKLKEVSYIFSDAYPAGELKHGTLALVDESTLSVVVICDERLRKKCENVVEQILSRKGKVAVITNLVAAAENLKGKVQTVLRIPACPPNDAPLLAATVMQLIAYKTAVLCGLNPDKPRNLAKSVTVE